jgi:hypothetical protein
MTTVKSTDSYSLLYKILQISFDEHIDENLQYDNTEENFYKIFLYDNWDCSLFQSEIECVELLIDKEIDVIINYINNYERENKELVNRETSVINIFNELLYCVINDIINEYKTKLQLFVNEIQNNKKLRKEVIQYHKVCSCGTTHKLKKCEGCKKVYYCSKECQIKDKENHKPNCSYELTYQEAIKKFQVYNNSE